MDINELKDSIGERFQLECDDILAYFQEEEGDIEKVMIALTTAILMTADIIGSTYLEVLQMDEKRFRNQLQLAFKEIVDSREIAKNTN